MSINRLVILVGVAVSLSGTPTFEVSARDNKGAGESTANQSSTHLDHEGLVPFASEEGLERLARSEARTDFPHLANHFDAQTNGLFCGPTSVAIVLNALRSYTDRELPRDQSLISEADKEFLSKDFDPSVARYTPETVVANSPKPRATVFGKPMRNSAGESQKDFGFQLRQLEELLRKHGAKTSLHVVTDQMTEDKVVDVIKANLAEPDDYVLINYKRAAVGQEGGGHISPVGAYDAESNSFLVLDVNPAKVSWVWMPAKTLVAGMQTFDTVENRGFIQVSELQN